MLSVLPFISAVLYQSVSATSRRMRQSLSLTNSLHKHQQLPSPSSERQTLLLLTKHSKESSRSYFRQSLKKSSRLVRPPETTTPSNSRLDRREISQMPPLFSILRTAL